MSHRDIEAASSSSEITRYKLAFSQYDPKGRGEIPTIKVGPVMWDVDFKVKESEIKKMKSKLDPDNIGTVRLGSFLKYLTRGEIQEEECIPLNNNAYEIRKRKDLECLFRRFDKENEGVISASQVSEFFECCSLKYKEDAYEEFKEVLDPENTGYVTLANINEFTKDRDIKLRQNVTEEMKNKYKLELDRDLRKCMSKFCGTIIGIQILITIIFLRYCVRSCSSFGNCQDNDGPVEQGFYTYTCDEEYKCICIENGNVTCMKGINGPCIGFIVTLIVLIGTISSCLYISCKSNDEDDPE